MLSRPRFNFLAFVGSLFLVGKTSWSLADPDLSEPPPLFYINLDRRPDRRSFMEREFERKGVSSEFEVIRYPARDGTSTVFTEEELAYFSDCDFKDSYNFNVLVANQLSHMEVWREVIRRGVDFAVVLQDDAELSDDFAQVVHQVMEHARPPDAAVIWLGLHRFADRSFSLPFPLSSPYDPNIFSDAIEGNDLVGTANWNPCSLAYTVTRAGALELLDHFLQHGIKRATDNAMIDALKHPTPSSVVVGQQRLVSRNRNYIARRVVATGHVSFMHDSDIFVPEDQPSMAPEYGQAYAESLALHRQQQHQQQQPHQQQHQQFDEAEFPVNTQVALSEKAIKPEL
jgi:GR25 family glycosyltransferase involved in LPS biosynthesis